MYIARNEAERTCSITSNGPYNPKRRHSTLSYLSPNDFDTKVD